MVTPLCQWVIAHTKIDPKDIAQALGIEETECWEFLEHLNRTLNEAEDAYRYSSSERRVALQAFIDELPEGQEVRRQLLLEKLYEAKRDPKKHDVKKLLSQVQSFGSDAGVNQQDILRAKEHPITALLNIHRPGNISCPFHQDRNPSFQVKKNNTFVCHSCNEYGDAIDLYMKLHSVDFKTAVKSLA